MPRSFSRATGPRAFRNVDVIHSGPAEPFRSILLMAYSSAERVNPFFELSNNIGIFDGHGRVAYFAVVINEDIGHCFSIDDRVTIMHRCLIGSLSQVYYLLHVLSIVIFYGVFKYFLPVVGLGIIDCLIGFSASFNRFLMVDMSCTTESVKSTNCSYVRCHPGFGFFVAIWFPLSELLVCVQNVSEVR